MHSPKGEEGCGLTDMFLPLGFALLSFHPKRRMPRILGAPLKTVKRKQQRGLAHLWVAGPCTITTEAAPSRRDFRRVDTMLHGPGQDGHRAQEIHSPTVTSDLALAQKSGHHCRSTDGKCSRTTNGRKSFVSPIFTSKSFVMPILRVNSC